MGDVSGDKELAFLQVLRLIAVAKMDLLKAAFYPPPRTDVEGSRSPAAVPGQVPEPPGARTVLVVAYGAEKSWLRLNQKSRSKRTNLSPEHVGKIKRPTDDQQQRYQQHLAYLKGMDGTGNAYRMAVEGESGAIEAELASMLQGLKEDLREKVPLLPEVRSAVPGRGDGTNSDDFSRLAKRDLRRSLQDNIDEITAKFSPFGAEDKHAFGQRRNLCVPFEDSAECPIPSRYGHALLCASSTSDVVPHPVRALPARLPQPAATNSTVRRLRSPPTSMAFAKPLA
ncbi:hypothetical protein AK812_SmicGene25491 [Symbiodinium microadriaticum]|uniref:Uncharacterized protein n=1 Tax=Symbiodinium microadriaticum TaxID=2951 RepID=A0A1Q9DBS7_SYMMI|nr:hypothetical protein AK812_SmicGene25491 [Symbiodinium microadriaticum]